MKSVVWHVCVCACAYHVMLCKAAYILYHSLSFPTALLLSTGTEAHQLMDISRLMDIYLVLMQRPTVMSCQELMSHWRWQRSMRLTLPTKCHHNPNESPFIMGSKIWSLEAVYLFMTSDGKVGYVIFEVANLSLLSAIYRHINDTIWVVSLMLLCRQ